MVRDFFVIRKTDYQFNDMDMKWLNILYSQLDRLIEENKIPQHRIIFISLYGSQNYNLATINSDVDCECAIYPSPDNFFFIQQPYSQKVHHADGDMYIKDIRLIFDELRKCSPNVLELLASKYIIINKQYEEQINTFLSYINDYAELSTYKLLKGLEGLFRRYTDKIYDNSISSKDIANILRIKEMIHKLTIDKKLFTDTLIPNDYKKLLEI